MRHRPGVALLEAIAAMTIIVIGGAGAVGTAAQAMTAVRHAWDAERQLRAAVEFLDVVTLWPQRDLDLRLGRHRQGPWILEIERAAPGLFLVTLEDSVGDRALLRTSVYRPRLR